MSYFDIGVLVIVLIAGLRGLYDGFIRSIFTFFGLLIGIFLASFYSQDIILFVSQNIYPVRSATTTQVVFFIAILFVVYLAFFLVGVGVSKFSKIIGLGFLDRFLGYVFASLKVFVILSFLVYGIFQIKFISEIDYVKQLSHNSVIYSAMSGVSKFLIRFGDFDAFRKDLKERVDKIQDPKQNNAPDPIKNP